VLGEFERPVAEMKEFPSEQFATLMNTIRGECIKDAQVFSRYVPFSSETYGEMHPVFVEDMIRNAKIKQSDIFVDIGSGIGNVVFQVAAQVISSK
jgi:hypothetical protein